ncbi:hypothetical protein BO71DRAFT_108668 [Aspergillus ellipticus CBS 707.79]|uniref:Uncharacterized protein n=1 Tax=Aspergillus ellipticus CBS 707.79 TaxID=1448320 RepID=A0A319CW00_9EURO|nr:hypothetical protein BO71DRAFT_108668 [Aspergillus ellipticus CBS 707.79]
MPFVFHAHSCCPGPFENPVRRSPAYAVVALCPPWRRHLAQRGVRCSLVEESAPGTLRRLARFPFHFHRPSFFQFPPHLARTSTQTTGRGWGIGAGICCELGRAKATGTKGPGCFEWLTSPREAARGSPRGGFWVSTWTVGSQRFMNHLRPSMTRGSRPRASLGTGKSSRSDPLCSAPPAAVPGASPGQVYSVILYERSKTLEGGDHGTAEEGLGPRLLRFSQPYRETAGQTPIHPGDSRGWLPLSSRLVIL